MNDVVTSDSYVAIRSVNGDRWWSIPSASGTLSAGDAKGGTGFFITKIHGSQGREIRSGDYVKIRGLDKDPWLKAIANQNQVLGSGGFSQDIDALFYIEKGAGGSPGNEIRVKEPFFIRGVASDPWLVSTGEGAVTLTQQKQLATEFLIDHVATLQDLAYQQGVIESTESHGNVIQLGWTNLPPCTRLEWPNVGPLGTPSPTWRSAEQRLFAYATVDQNLLNQAKNETLYCAAVAAAAAGIGALISGGAGATGAFDTAFKACLLDKGVPQTLSRAVTLSTDAKCMW